MGRSDRDPMVDVRVPALGESVTRKRGSDGITYASGGVTRRGRRSIDPLVGDGQGPEPACVGSALLQGGLDTGRTD